MDTNNSDTMTAVTRKRGRDVWEMEMELENNTMDCDSSDSEFRQDTYYSSQDSLMNNSQLHNQNSSFNQHHSISAKKGQHHKIHTEGHQRTVAMMMEAAQKLTFEPETQPESPIHENMDSQLTPVYTQRPFW